MSQYRLPAPDEQTLLEGLQVRVMEPVELPRSHRLLHRRHYLGSLKPEGRLVSLDAMHTQDETARELVIEYGADYLLTVKDNQATVHRNIEQLISAPEADFPPSRAHADPSSNPGDQQKPA
ncbi:MAG: hypothetical protein FJ387_21715 [Verrucomicrobia bacterium]|nr:hypothetical protein [Verrucomicrobiota bacterium]